MVLSRLCDTEMATGDDSFHCHVVVTRLERSQSRQREDTQDVRSTKYDHESDLRSTGGCVYACTLATGDRAAIDVSSTAAPLEHAEISHGRPVTGGELGTLHRNTLDVNLILFNLTLLVSNRSKLIVTSAVPDLKNAACW